MGRLSIWYSMLFLAVTCFQSSCMLHQTSLNIDTHKSNNNIFSERKTKKRKKKKGYAISTASVAAADKVFYQNTTPQGVEILIKTRRA